MCSSSVFLLYSNSLTSDILAATCICTTIAVDEIRRVVVESLLPFLKGLLVGRKKKKANGDEMAAALSDTALTEYDQFDDYLEMVIQFGVSHDQLL